MNHIQNSLHSQDNIVDKVELLAKPDVLLINHLKDTLDRVKELDIYLQIPKDILKKAFIAAITHDIGKANKNFQDYIRNKIKKSFPHALLSFLFTFAFEMQFFKDDGSSKDFEASVAVLTHHSPLKHDLYTSINVNVDLYELLNQIVNSEVLHEVLNILEDLDLKLNNRVQFVDWLKYKIKNVNHNKNGQGGLSSFNIEFNNMSPEIFSTVKGLLVLSDWSKSANKSIEEILLIDGSKYIESYTNKFYMRDFQLKCRDSNSDILYLRAPTGSGKTEALLLWSRNSRRIIYLLPTQATTNAIFERFMNIFPTELLGISHGNAGYIINIHDEFTSDTKTFSRIFAKPVMVATLDQYLSTHLRSRHWEEKLFACSHASVIFDEIHAYEPYTIGLLVRSLEKNPPKSYALASATLPKSLLKHFPDNDKAILIEADKFLWEKKRHRIHLLSNRNILEDGVDLAIQHAQEGKKVLVVLNTINQSQIFYKNVKDRWNCDRISLLHSRFILRDRQEKEQLVKEVEGPFIFVSTQVIEVSLDISYDVLITDIAPIDALIQRMGRVNRRGDNPPAPVYIYTRITESSRKVYGNTILNKTSEILKTLPEEPDNKELSNATETLYDYIINTKEWQKEFKKGKETIDEIQKMLGCFTINLSKNNEKQILELFKTRSGSITIDVIPGVFEPEVELLKSNGQLWRLSEFLVPVPLWWKKEFKDCFVQMNDLGIYKVNMSYDKEVGLQPVPIGEDYMMID